MVQLWLSEVKFEIEHTSPLNTEFNIVFDIECGVVDKIGRQSPVSFNYV